jgi:hypothetical protein
MRPNDPTAASPGRPADYISALADAGASPDNLDEAQRLVDQEASITYSALAAVELAKTLALIDIGRSLRDIRDELHDMRYHGLKVNGK